MVQELALGAILLVFAFTFWRPLSRVRTVLGIPHLVSTGHAFLVLGYLFGLAAGERSRALIDDLGPVVAFVAGWVGFATGMRFEVRVLRAVPKSYIAVSLTPALAACTVVGALGAVVLAYTGVPLQAAWLAAMVLAAAGASSGPTLAALLRVRRAGRSSHARPLLRLIEFSSNLDDILVILLAILAFALFRTTDDPVRPEVLIAAALGGGALFGVITWLFLGGKAREDERLLLGLAMLAFTAGFAGWLHFSPAAVGAIAAMVLVNLPGERDQQLIGAIRRVERPAVVILMTVVGVHAAGAMNTTLLALIVLLTLVRLLTKRLTTTFLPVSVAGGAAANRRWGSGLAAQGTLGLIVALSYFHIWRDDVAETVLAAVALASVINELIAPWLLLRLIRRAELNRIGQSPARGGAA